MAPIVTETAAPVPHALLAPLRDHLPHSFSVLRRAQFSHFLQGTTPHARFLFASGPDDNDEGPRRGGEGELGGGGPSPSPRHFAAAYLDLSQYPETQMYTYSTLQDYDDDDDAGDLPPAEVEHVLDLLGALLRRVRRIAKATIAGPPPHPLPPPGPRREGLMVGGLHEATYRLLLARRGLASSYWNPHDVWLFRVEELPPAPESKDEEGLAWGVVRREDVPLIASRTGIPKVEATLMSEPSVAVRDARGRLVAWAFMGTAGTLSTLHVEVSIRMYFLFIRPPLRVRSFVFCVPG